NYIIFLKQFQENKKAIHPPLIEVWDFLLDIVKSNISTNKFSFFLKKNIVSPLKVSYKNILSKLYKIVKFSMQNDIINMEEIL
uniref:hypothetical protein n=1 Tax=Fusobacterium pseudoperiodonticum TaxID=2663009 RepID=UPI0028EBF819